MNWKDGEDRVMIKEIRMSVCDWQRPETPIYSLLQESKVKILRNIQITKFVILRLHLCGIQCQINPLDRLGRVPRGANKRKTQKTKKMFILIIKILNWHFQWSCALPSIILSVRPWGSNFANISGKLLRYFEIN